MVVEEVQSSLGPDFEYRCLIYAQVLAAGVSAENTGAITIPHKLNHNGSS